MYLVECLTRRVQGTVQEVLPITGLAYVSDKGVGTWAITKSTEGIGLGTLREGQRVELTIKDFTGCSLVSGYALLD